MEVIIGIYLLWGTYSSWKFISRRNGSICSSLNGIGLQYKLLKLVSSVIMGSIFGVIYFVVSVLKLMGSFEKY